MAIFQSTHPLRGATRQKTKHLLYYTISIHAPLAGCDAGQVVVNVGSLISIHAPLAGCDCSTGRPWTYGGGFQSTHPLRGATPLARLPALSTVISIHAPLAGCDLVTGFLYGGDGISIHAPLAGCDRGGERERRPAVYFNPRTPCGVRQWSQPLGAHDAYISIHAPLAGCDSKSAQKNAALLRKRYKYKFFVCKKCTSGDLTGAYSSKNTLYSGANCSENPCALSVRTHRISGPSTSNPGLMPKCSILERYFSPR